MNPSLEGIGAEDLRVETLGAARFPNRCFENNISFVSDDERILIHARTLEISGGSLLSYEAAGPREKLFFDPEKTVCGIVTCGGLCPGMNAVIRSITLTLRSTYGVKRVLGFTYGYKGLSRSASSLPVELDETAVESIHEQGGTVLGSSRGPQNPAEMVDSLERCGVQVLFTIGGDGTLRGAHDIAEEVKRRGLAISVIGIPKTIDNDILCTQTSFGFETAVEVAARALAAAHEEAHASENGIALVKLMGRESGFITAFATLASTEVNFCLIPEVPFRLEGEGSLLDALERRLEVKKHVMIAVAEGAGQHLFSKEKRGVDASGNPVFEDIGPFLKEKILGYFSGRSKKVSVKYIDPSYLIRSVPPSAFDAIFCLRLGQNAVHAALAGKTDMLVGFWNQFFTHVPLPIAVKRRKKIDPNDRLWQCVLGTTGQMRWCRPPRG